VQAEANENSLGAGLFGYDLGVIAYVLEAPDFLDTIGRDTSTAYTGFIVSSLLLGYVSFWLGKMEALLTWIELS
jgi:hypothetical protein